MAEVIIANSDCIEIREAHNETELIAYSNENDFANISYSIVPRPTFYVRVHCKFFKERFPEENESEPLSDNVVVKLSGSVKSQKLLQVEPIPYYFHSIMKLILQHNYILIAGEEWEKEEGYEMKGLNEQFPFESAEAWLTLKEGGYFTNVYGEI